MMRKIVYLMTCAGVMLCVSCKKQATFEKDEVLEKNGHELIVNDDSTFTGEIWDEAHRQCVEMKDGRKMKIILTHENGQVAAERTYATKDKAEEIKLFDESGNEITKQEFAKRYRNLIVQFGEAL